MASTPQSTEAEDDKRQEARERVASIGRNDTCFCGSGKKYKKCHLLLDQDLASPPAGPPDPMAHVQAGWRMFEQRRPGAAEKEFRAALGLKADLPEARVGIGLAKLSAGDNDGAKEALAEVVKDGEPMLAQLRTEGVKDGFSRPEAQPTLRACHALGCLAHDQDRFDDALRDLERVYAVDTGPVGTEARLIAGKTLIKQKRPQEAIPVLKEAAESQNGPARAYMGLCLASWLAGEKAAGDAYLDQALEQNPHFGKALLGQIRKQVDNPLGATPGSREEAVVYAQTYGDTWDEAAKTQLGEALATREAKPAPSAPTDEATAP